MSNFPFLAFVIFVGLVVYVSIGAVVFARVDDEEQRLLSWFKSSPVSILGYLIWPYIAYEFYMHKKK